VPASPTINLPDFLVASTFTLSMSNATAFTFVTRPYSSTVTSETSTRPSPVSFVFSTLTSASSISQLPELFVICTPSPLVSLYTGSCAVLVSPLAVT
jgi:hypothetical protein